VVYHARNLDFAPESLMKDLVYTAIFTRNGTRLAPAPNPQPDTRAPISPPRPAVLEPAYV
jgi:hypothetical protein